jgi:hypothetical protein
LTRKSITTNPPVVACDVCGRTLLRGETADVFIANGARRNVCELCTGRAVHEGWIREGPPDHDDEPVAPQPEPAPVVLHEPHHRHTHQQEPTPDQALYEHRSVHGVPTNAELKVARAMELFNASPQIRTVSGVARSLGSPIVSARPSKTEGSVVTIVVAWELSWYRFEVDLGNEAAGVRVTAQGSELSELDTIDQTPNAAADEFGRLHPAASLA